MPSIFGSMVVKNGIKQVIYNFSNARKKTYAQVQAMSDAEKQGVIICDDYPVTEGYAHYTTTEQKIGTWIDGTPVYEKTINFGNLPNNTTKSVSHGITNLDKCIEIKGVMANGAGTTFYCLPFPDTSAVANNLFIYCNGTGVSITAAANYSTNTAYITLRYTKTS